MATSIFDGYTPATAPPSSFDQSADIRAVLQYARWQVYNVLGYGAVADGVHDDAIAFQNAIDAAFAAGGGVVHAPAGAYYLATGLVLKANVTLSGDGWATRLVTGNHWLCRADQVDRPCLRDVYVDNSLNTADTVSVWFTRCTNAVMERVYLYNFNQFGLQLNGCTHSVIRDCVADTGRNLQNAIMVSNDFGAGYVDAHCAILGCVVKGTGQNHDLTVAQVRSVVVANNVCASNDISIEQAGDVVVSGNRVQTGITFFSANVADPVRAGVQIVGNLVVAATAAVGGGINVVNASTGKVVITGNRIKAAVDYGIRANQSNNAGVLTISDNQIESVTSSGTAYGIAVDYAQSLACNGNVIAGVGIGILLGSSLVGFTLGSNEIQSPTSIGIRIQGKTGTLTGNTITGGGAQGVYCDGVSDNITATGNTIDSALANITFAYASATNCVASGNTLMGAGAGVFFTGGATGRRYGNVGYVTENQGQATINDGGTITHGCAETPTSALISVGTANVVFSVTIGPANLTVSLKDRATGNAVNGVAVNWRAVCALAGA